MAMAGESSSAVQKELKRSKSGLRILARLDSQSSPFLLDEPHWIPDHEILQCQQCEKKFNFTTRKHHCRRCGRIFCDKDVRHKLPLPRLSFVDPVRMCSECAAVTKKENEFFDKHLKVLTSGAAFNVTSTAHKEPDEECQFQCKLSSSSHRYIELQSSLQAHDNIDINAVLKAQVLAVAGDTGSNVANGIILKYKDFSDREQTITLRVKADGSRKAAVVWIVAMQRAIKMLFEGRAQCADN